MTRLTGWRDIRALRAAPPGEAARDSERKKTFVAALRQAEELAEAASSTSYATKALPLFYSLSQAGRAIAAAHLPDPWRLRWHGLSVREDAEQILDTIVSPASRAQDSYQGTATAIGSPGLSGPTSLGALWTANPDLLEVSPPATAGQWPPAITIPLGTLKPPPGSDPGYGTSAVSTDGTVSTAVDIQGTTGAEITTALCGYPSLREAFGVKQGLMGGEEAGPSDVVVRSDDRFGRSLATIGLPCPSTTTMTEMWDRQRAFASIVETDRAQPRTEPPQLVGFALPEIAGGPSPHPLMLWWALLLGLSSLTRYEPAAWSAAIDLDASELAVPLEQVLEIAEDRLPARILESLRGC
ncbi:YaaC family protein [Amycolatopsis sp. cmx-11-12]|uniref:YaaC family protein n=1 Tax=Amycolatopsis sp. cmx-11-12 TaxID=2785795 RepID=UPI003917F4F1